MLNLAAIPTKFQGVQFRSRLEAKWAAFFTKVGWPWTYEPFDLPGWIPDFSLDFETPVLVEVKPAASFNELEKLLEVAHHQKWDTLLVGNKPFLDDKRCTGCHSDGWAYLLEAPYATDLKPLEIRSHGLGFGKGPAYLFTCTECLHPSFSSIHGFHACRRCGFWDGTHGLKGPAFDFETAWKEACNEVQWKGSK